MFAVAQGSQAFSGCAPFASALKNEEDANGRVPNDTHASSQTNGLSAGAMHSQEGQWTSFMTNIFVCNWRQTDQSKTVFL